MPELSQVVIAQPSARLIDPYTWIDTRAGLSIRFAIYESLVKYDHQARLVPGLAESWSVDTDACTWTFRLRSGVRFHDGSELSAEDAAASLRFAFSPERPGEYGTAALLALYLEKARVEALDSCTLRVITPEPLADLLDLLVYAVIVPAAHLGQAPGSIPGTGPYRYGGEASREVRLKRWDGYWGGAAPVESLVFHGVPSREERIQVFLQGKADIATYLSPLDAPAFEPCAWARTLERSTPMCVILMFNARTGPCKDRRVRQALNYAADVPQLIEKIYQGRAERLSGPLSRHHSGTDPQAAPYPHDVQKARSLLADAGYPDGITLLLDRPVISPDESPELAALLRSQWAEAGITLQERVHENREQYSLKVRGKEIGDICVFDSSPMSTFRVLREKLHSGFAGPWWEGYHNPQVNALMEQAWKTAGEEQRTQLYRQAVRLVQEDAPWLFLYNPHDLIVVHRRIGEALPGWSVGVDGLVLFGQGGSST